ncbi:unnamed protein product [Periconia digitata]|uniref:Uncharacterized protein n=1 Tax=Periconia digitata TaxID=1303443 RepID=A0A9W4XN22_9PLEO|nr:unnamed protein product [Periconia digitata]
MRRTGHGVYSFKCCLYQGTSWPHILNCLFVAYIANSPILFRLTGPQQLKSEELAFAVTCSRAHDVLEEFNQHPLLYHQLRLHRPHSWLFQANGALQPFPNRFSKFKPPLSIHHTLYPYTSPAKLTKMVNLKPLQKPISASWERTITRNDYNKMLKGFQPSDMDHKWGMQADAPDAQGNINLHAYRSWMSEIMFSITVEVADLNSTEDKDWAKVVKISWNEQPGGMKVSEAEAKEDMTDLCRNLLSCKI